MKMRINTTEIEAYSYLCFYFKIDYLKWFRNIGYLSSYISMISTNIFQPEIFWIIRTNKQIHNISFNVIWVSWRLIFLKYLSHVLIFTRYFERNHPLYWVVWENFNLFFVTYFFFFTSLSETLLNTQMCMIFVGFFKVNSQSVFINISIFRSTISGILENKWN